MKEEKCKGAVGIPRGVTAIFLVNDAKEAKKIVDALSHMEDKQEFVIAGGLSVLYKKTEWGIVET